MTTKLAGALAAGALVIGILVGAAGSVLVYGTTGDSMAMSDMSDAGDMGQMHEMMSKMVGSNMGPGASMAPVDDAQHHAGRDQ